MKVVFLLDEFQSLDWKFIVPFHLYWRIEITLSGICDGRDDDIGKSVDSTEMYKKKRISFMNFD